MLPAPGGVSRLGPFFYHFGENRCGFTIDFPVGLLLAVTSHRMKTYYLWKVKIIDQCSYLWRCLTHNILGHMYGKELVTFRDYFRKRLDSVEFVESRARAIHCRTRTARCPNDFSRLPQHTMTPNPAPGKWRSSRT